MLCGGDEISRTQNGNNNGYCQDNEISWLDWKLDHAKRNLLEFVRRLIAFRKKHPVLRRRRFFQCRHIRGSEVKDISWFKPDGKEMTDEDWSSGYAKSLALRLAGDAIGETDEKGRAIVDDTLLILINAHDAPLAFTLPTHKRIVHWQPVLDASFAVGSERSVASLKGGERYDVDAHSIVVLMLGEK